MPSSNSSSVQYRKLEFHLVDSQSCQRFWTLPYGASISKATLKPVEPATWKAINDHLVPGHRLGVWKKANGFGSMPRRSYPLSARQ